MKIGEIVLVSKVTDNSDKKKKFFPFFLKEFGIRRKECITYDKPNMRYNSYLSDMESIGFFFSANKFSTKEYIFSLKIISDNKDDIIDFKSRKIVYDLILKKMYEIDNFIEKLKNIKNESLNDSYFNECFERFTKKYSFTFSQEIKLKKLLKVYLSRKSLVLEYFFKKFKDADSIIDNLKQYLKYEV